MHENELLHYGVLGMKWGVRRTPEQLGSKRTYKAVKKAALEGGSGAAKDVLKNHDDIKQIHKDLSSARQKLREAKKLSKEFNELDQEEQNKYCIKAARKFCKDYDISDKDEIKYYEEMYLYEDLDQGMTNSFGMFLKDKGIEPKAYSDMQLRASKEYRQACESATEKLLEKTGNLPIQYTNRGTTENYKTAVNDVLARMAHDEIWNEGYYESGW
ncbi:MAG: hypothetical protein J6B01_04755 [Ruminococcus sp.]|nr:hypothetical protein [Ruminococcus sp.]